MKTFKTLVVVLALAAAGVGIRYLITSGPMKLDRIEVAGNEQASAAEIAESTQLQKEAHLLSLSTRTIASRVERVPWVKTAKVERILPSTIRITVTERRAQATLIIGDVSYLIDREGVVLAEGKSSGPDLIDFPAQELSPGTRIDSAALRHVFLILDVLPRPMLDRIESVRAPSVDRIALLLDGDVTVLYGAAESIEDKNFAVQALLEKYAAEGVRVEHIDVRVPARPAVRTG